MCLIIDTSITYINPYQFTSLSMKMTKCLSLLAVIVVMALSSCSTPKNVVYFQDTTAGTIDKIAGQEQIKLRPGDMLNIVVSSKEPELALLFNKTQVSSTLGGGSGGSGNSLMGYTVNPEGYIDFPQLGEVMVQGLTRIQLERLLQDKLRSLNLLKDAMVTVEFNNLIVTVLGEVGSPGVYHITRDDPTILDVIAQAGDLTIDGLRENVKVYRKQGNEEKTYLVDLTSAQNVFSSPVYYMQQGDIIYVEPNSKQINNSTNNGNTIRTYAFWMSLTSFLLSIGVLVFK